MPESVAVFERGFGISARNLVEESIVQGSGPEPGGADGDPRGSAASHHRLLQRTARSLGRSK